MNMTDKLKAEWIKSGEYTTKTFKQWYNDRSEKIASDLWEQSQKNSLLRRQAI